MTFDETEEVARPRPVLRGLWFILAPLLAIGLLAMGTGILVGPIHAGKFGTGFFIALGLAAAMLDRRRLADPPYPPRLRAAAQPTPAPGAAAALPRRLAGGAARRGDGSPAGRGAPPGARNHARRSTAPSPDCGRLGRGRGTEPGAFGALAQPYRRARARCLRLRGVVALYLYFALTALWWLLWRAALPPAPDGLAILIAVTTAWILAWLFRRFR